MISSTHFLEEEVPYEKLEKLGISRKSLVNMPKEVVTPLMLGRVTPLIMTRYQAENGKVIEMPMKLQLTRDKNSEVNLMTYQVRKDIERGHVRLKDKEIQRLKDGEVLRKPINEGGVRKHKYIQLDQETQSLMLRDSAPVMVALRLHEKVKDIELGTNQKQAAIDGKPIELTVGDQKVTVGVDLREPQGFKVVNGDMNEWERQMKIKYDHEHEGFMGYVQTDENRWEYRQVTERLSHKEDEKTTLRHEEKRSSGLKL